MKKEIHPDNQSQEQGSDAAGMYAVRQFVFRALHLPELPETAVVAKKIETLPKLLEKIQTKEGQSFAGALQLLEFFKSIRIPVISSQGRETGVFRSPHALIAGGFVRDIIMGRPPKDIDFAVGIDHDLLVSFFNSHFQKELAEKSITISVTGSRYKVLRVHFRDEKGGVREEYEIASFREEGDYTDGRRPGYVRAVKHAGVDASRRDLTINALFYNPFTGAVIDYVGGLRDIETRTLRFVGDPEKRIAEDYVRMLRYIRFLARTGFDADLQAKAAIIKYAHQIESRPGEPLQDELEKILVEEKPGSAVRLLYEYGLLRYLIPEVAALKDCPQGPPYHMEGDVLTHTVMTMDALPKEASLTLRWAAMLHDVAKAGTRAVEETPEGEKVSFLGHAELGALQIPRVVGHLRLSGEMLHRIKVIVENHIRMFSFPDMREGKARELAELPEFEDLIELAIADSRSSIPADPKFREENEQMIAAIKDRFKKIREFKEQHARALTEVEKAVNGKVIIDRYTARWGKPPVGKEIGNLKEEIMARIRERRVVAATEALKILEEVVAEGLPKHQ